MKEKIEIGKLLEKSDIRRDAIHIAVIPVTIGYPMEPGTKVFYVKSTGEVFPNADEDQKAIGIIDPYLSKPLEVGDRAYLFLYPDTITSLRHVWKHPEI
jgi:hypothetical protein